MDIHELEHCRDYLKLLAQSQMDSWLGKQLDASDLAQQTLLVAVSQAHQFRGTTNAELLAWLRRILTNNLIDAFRYHRRGKRDHARLQSLEEEITSTFRRIESLADSSPSPSQRASTNEYLLRLPAALDALTPPQREAIILHHIQGMKLAETSQRMGRSAGSVCGLLHRGLKRLYEIMEEQP